MVLILYFISLGNTQKNSRISTTDIQEIFMLAIFMKQFRRMYFDNFSCYDVLIEKI